MEMGLRDLQVLSEEAGEIKMTQNQSPPEWAVEMAQEFIPYFDNGIVAYCGTHDIYKCEICLGKIGDIAHALTAARTRGWNEAVGAVESSIEEVAELEHHQWMVWTSSLMSSLEVSAERMERWQKYHVPYSELDEDSKDLDREWAAKVLAALVQELKKPEGEK